MSFGDIYKWRWKDDHPRRKQCEGTGTLYWCMSQIAKEDKQGNLWDTYWVSGDNKKVNPEEVVLEYIGNAFELERIDDYQSVYYDEKDIVNLNHANSTKGNMFKRKGAEKSLSSIRKLVNDRIAELKNEHSYINMQIERLEALDINKENINSIYI